MTIKAVIFDFGGVVAQPMPPLMSAIEADYGLAPGALGDFFYRREHWREAEVGRLSYEDYTAVCTNLLAEATGSRARGEEAWARWYREFYRPAFMPGVLDIVRELRTVVRVAMLSNASLGMEERLRDLLGIAHLFDPLVSSATIGLAKPNAAAFHATIDRMGLEPQDCFFIDDTPVNIDASRALGITSYLFGDAAGLRRALLEAGLSLGP